MDVVDLANDLVDQTLERAVRAVRGAVAPPPSGPVCDRGCTECGGLIGVDRLQAVPNAIRCVWCESIQERRFGHGGAR